MADSIPGTIESRMNETWGHLHQQSLGLGRERLILQTENKRTSQTAMRAVKRHGGLKCLQKGLRKSSKRKLCLSQHLRDAWESVANTGGGKESRTKPTHSPVLGWEGTRSF